MKQEKSMAQWTRNLLAIGLMVFACVAAARAQPTAFTYQGRLTDSTVAQPTSGTYQMQFALFGSIGGADQIGATVVNPGVAVTGGVFTVSLDFGANSFAGADRFLEIRVFNPATSAYVVLNPRQPITSTPYSIRALNAGTANDALNVGGTPAAQIIKEGDTRLTDTRTPTSGSGDYIQNQNAAAQTSTNFRIDGTGAANIFSATTQFNIGGERVFSTSGVRNTFAGNYAGANNPGSNNSFFGSEAGIFSLTGISNSFFGSYAGQTNQGNSNSFFGSVAGAGNGTGSQNVFIGFITGGTNRTGSNNTILGARADVVGGDLSFATAIGAGATVSDSNSVVLGRTSDTVRIPGTLNVSTFTAAALSANTVNADTQFNIGGNPVFSAPGLNTFVGFFTGGGGSANSFFGNEAGRNTTGSLNSFFGSGAGLSNLSGGENSFFGRSAGISNTSGSANSMFGLQAGSGNKTGINNSFFGVQAGFGNVGGGNNTIIGMNANVGSGNLDYAAAFGSGAVVRTPNTIVLGRENGTDKIRIFGLGAAGATPLCRNADNEISTCAGGNLAKENRADAEQINSLREQVKQQQIMIDGLRKLVCANNPNAAVCQ